ncbi:hypothetical protein ACT4US_00200 [Bacillus sp. HC-Mk]
MNMSDIEVGEVFTLSDENNEEQEVEVLDGTNAVMLSAESASGEHPIESVRTLRLVSEFAEHVKKDGPFAMKDVLQLLRESLDE